MQTFIGKSLSKNQLVFVALLIGPSVLLYGLSRFDSSSFVDAFSAAVTLAAKTFCPFTGALYFDRAKSIYLSLLIPLLLTLVKLLDFDGAERVVVVGFLVFLALSVLSCALGWLIKLLYRKRYAKTSKGGHAA
jgi:hypothetical protein